MAGIKTHCAWLLSLAVVSAAATANAATYEVGPGRSYANITDVPLGSLGPGDVVLIYWQATPCYERFGIDTAGTATDPIVIRGVPNGQRQLPVVVWVVRISLCRNAGSVAERRIDQVITGFKPRLGVNG